MKPIKFPQANRVLQRPANMSENECEPLHVWSSDQQCISCWKPSVKERLNILFGGKVWLGVLSGGTQPPVYVVSEKLFQSQPKTSRLRVFVDDLVYNTAVVIENIMSGLKQSDKRLHLYAGIAISFVVGFFVPWLGLLLGCIAGLMKEVWDSQGNGTVEVMDFVFTCIGATIALPFAWLLHNWVW